MLKVPGYVYYSFVSNFAALRFNNFTTKFSAVFNISMLPNQVGNWSGAPLSGDQPAIDESRSLVFIATGGLYSAPENYSACETAQSNTSQPVDLVTDLWHDTVLTVGINTGDVKWSSQLTPLGAGNVLCNSIPAAHLPNSVPCSTNSNSNACKLLSSHIPATALIHGADFGMSPTFVYDSSADTPNHQDTVVVSQKIGILYALSAKDGHTFWSAGTSPGGADGGLSLGVIVDDVAVYFIAINSNGVPFPLQPSNVLANNSAYGGAAPANGSIPTCTAVLQSTESTSCLELVIALSTAMMGLVHFMYSKLIRPI